ncbi:MAG TPA: Fur family transcriptional regulator [Candidatus Polarisedimenticolaceae bacterium]|nr:Fur family transcriptional regulator [Candidatus Polarisedimenticolaceae bacterium]
MISKFKDYLRQSGQSVTGPRLRVFEFMQNHHPTTVAAIIQKLEPEFDRASVYRTLNLLRGLDVIHDIVAGGKRMIELSDVFDNHHHHITCLMCGTHETIQDDRVEQALAQIAKTKGYENATHQLQINGICKACASAQHATG